MWNRYHAVHSSKRPSLEGHPGTSLSAPRPPTPKHCYQLAIALTLGGNRVFQTTPFFSQATPPPLPRPLPPPPPPPRQTQGARELNRTAPGRLQAGLSSADSPLSHLLPFRSPPTRLLPSSVCSSSDLSFPALPVVAASGGGKQLRYLGAQSCKLVSSCRDLWRCHHALFCSGQGRWASLV